MAQRGSSWFDRVAGWALFVLSAVSGCLMSIRPDIFPSDLHLPVLVHRRCGRGDPADGALPHPTERPVNPCHTADPHGQQPVHPLQPDRRDVPHLAPRATSGNTTSEILAAPRARGRRLGLASIVDRIAASRFQTRSTRAREWTPRVLSKDLTLYHLTGNIVAVSRVVMRRGTSYQGRKDKRRLG
jgi:hypothetical protein